ncbi:MAG: hypothetical protein QOJ30_400 [Pseudonocardiales bacterium]|nr:hypothetical protein [Pseudonocardiales bacterium]
MSSVFAPPASGPRARGHLTRFRQTTARAVLDSALNQANGTWAPLSSEPRPRLPTHAAETSDEWAGAVGVFLSRYVRPSAAVGWA